jgi:predicted metal-dependent peptidase
MTKLSAEQRVQKAHIALMNEPKYCLYSGIFMMGRTTVMDQGCPTAYTDGFNTRYGRAFVDKLSDPELRGLILHENLHKAFRHLTTWEDLYKKSPRKANMACDYVINLMIHDSDPEGKFVTLPEGGLLDEQYRGLDAGTVFRLLKDNGGGKRRGRKGETGETGDNGGSDGTEPSDGGDDEETQGGFDEHGWDEAQELSSAEKEKIARDIDQALRQGALLAGKLGANVPREITDILESKIDWREALREFITSYCAEKDLSTWRRPNRRWVDRDVYLPSTIGESVGQLVIGIDTSGSINNEIIGQFLGEVRAICQSVTPESIELLYWDTRVCQHESYDRDSFDALLTSTKPRGGGGTYPQCVSNYIRDKKLKPEAIIMLTDGFVDGWGRDWNAPMLWGVTVKGNESDVGVTVHIGD